MSAEKDRLGQPEWKAWGPYVAERAWGTVREDYSPDEPRAAGDEEELAHVADCSI